MEKIKPEAEECKVNSLQGEGGNAARDLEIEQLREQLREQFEQKLREQKEELEQKLREQNEQKLREQKEELEQKQELEQKLREAEKKIAKLEERGTSLRSTQNCPLGFVQSIAAASKSKTGRNIYYGSILKMDPVKGGFAASEVYIDFVKGARSLSFPKLSTSSDEAVNGLISALQDRKDGTLLPSSSKDLEQPQSMVAALILDELIGNYDTGTGTRIRVTHQGTLKGSCTADAEDDVTGFINVIYEEESMGGGNRQKCWKKESETTTGSLNMDVDILLTVVHDGKLLPFMTGAYKPTNTKEVELEAECDMYATNVLSYCQQVCIGLEIGGGNTVDSWIIKAWGYFLKPRSGANEQIFEKSLLFEGEGLEGLHAVSLGLVHAVPSFLLQDTSAKLGKRLGPVVGHFPTKEKVVKVYDNARYRKPNLAIVKQFVDPAATLTTTDDRTCCFLEMAHFDSDWTCPVPVATFVAISSQLKQLHKEHGPHGDIRLANLLSCGKIIDFDFMGNETYHENLQDLVLDGERHTDVVTAINDGTIGQLEMQEEHDYFSLAQVMQKFVVVDDTNHSAWIDACEVMESNQISTAIEKLSQLTWEVEWAEDLEPLMFDTGPTPTKRA